MDADEFFQTYIFGVDHNSKASTRLHGDKFSCQIDVKVWFTAADGKLLSS